MMMMIEAARGWNYSVHLIFLQLVAKNCASTLRVLDIEWSTKVFTFDKFSSSNLSQTFPPPRWQMPACPRSAQWSIWFSFTSSLVASLGRVRYVMMETKMCSKGGWLRSLVKTTGSSPPLLAQALLSSKRGFPLRGSRLGRVAGQWRRN